MTIDITIPSPWTVISEPEGNLTSLGDYIAVEHPEGLIGTVEVEQGRYDTTEVFATILNEEADEDDQTLESLWLSSEDFEDDVETTRDEVVDEFEHWLDQYQDWSN